jgi:hypothetical protein
MMAPLRGTCDKKVRPLGVNREIYLTIENPSFYVGRNFAVVR